VVPMETKLGEVGAYSSGGRFGKGDPAPFANHFGKLVLLGHPTAEFFEYLFNGKFPVEFAFGKIDVRLNRVRSWEFGVRSERRTHLPLTLSPCREGIGLRCCCCGCRCRVLSGQLLGSVLSL